MAACSPELLRDSEDLARVHARINSLSGDMQDRLKVLVQRIVTLEHLVTFAAGASAREVTLMVRPKPRWWPEPITLEEYEQFTPEKLEVVNGYLIDGPESNTARLDLLAVLLKNCGLEAAAFLASKEDWRKAMERAFPDFWE
jgi:hypothetical protein